MLTTLALYAFLQVSAAALPQGFEDTNWGMTVEELKKLHPVQKAEEGTKYGYADHLEDSPDVHVLIREDNTRVEYYFFQGKLYKVFVVYDRAATSPEFYKKLVVDKQKEFGPAQSHYQEEYMGMLVLHVKWEDSNTILDLRSAAGYVYQVLMDKKAKNEKANLQLRKRTI